MSWREFTQEELTDLRSNPYVKSATTRMVRFTAEFKERFWSEYSAGKNPRRIIKDIGLDPDVLGEPRINGIRKHIQDLQMKQAASVNCSPMGATIKVAIYTGYSHGCCVLFFNLFS